ncbi:MAG: serine/threonine protein kinase [Deltaproteobacteria bacterium]|nr:serine/threonine protein kinase [Deltaproteobacteria bacterium]
MSSEPYTEASRLADPCTVAEITLAAALHADADAVFIEPMPMNENSYAITLERGNSVLSTTPLELLLGTAVIARLAFIADLDLAAGHPSSAVLSIRSGTRNADVLITIRPGTNLRADVMVLSHLRKGASITTSGPAPGDAIGSYKVLELLGEGGMGTVFRVEQLADGQRFALKVLRSRVVERDPTAADKFLRDARTASRIRHPNIVDVFDFGHLPDGRPYFVMELLEGESLGTRVGRGALPPADVVTIARQLATALAAAHERGVIHADITPSNVIVLPGTPELHVKLVDFGLAELAGEGVRDEIPDLVLGTPAYISPEQLRGLSPSERSDQYGLGAVLFELLTGHPPFQSPDLRELCMMHVSAPVPAVESPHGPLPPKLVDLVTTCLQKAPKARFPSMRALLVVLEEIERIIDRRGWRRWLSS